MRKPITTNDVINLLTKLVIALVVILAAKQFLS